MPGVWSTLSPFLLPNEGDIHNAFSSFYPPQQVQALNPGPYHVPGKFSTTELYSQLVEQWCLASLCLGQGLTMQPSWPQITHLLVGITGVYHRALLGGIIWLWK